MLPKNAKELQEDLANLGFYNYKVDGDIGPKTKAAVNQWLNSLTVTPITLAGKEVGNVGEVKIFKTDRGFKFTAGMNIDADGSPHAYHSDNSKALDFLANAGKPGNWWGIVTDKNGKPVVQGPKDPAPGFYVSTTALENPGFAREDPRRYVNSEEVHFIVIPKKFQFGELNDKVEVTYNGKTVQAIVADIGPVGKIGEGSIALAKSLGIPSHPKNGGVGGGVTYEIITGITGKTVLAKKK